MIDREDRAIFSEQLQHRRTRGRPRLVQDQRSVSLTVSVPEALYDKIAREATQARIEIAPFVRSILSDYSTEK